MQSQRPDRSNFAVTGFPQPTRPQGQCQSTHRLCVEPLSSNCLNLIKRKGFYCTRNPSEATFCKHCIDTPQLSPNFNIQKEKYCIVGQSVKIFQRISVVVCSLGQQIFCLCQSSPQVILMVPLIKSVCRGDDMMHELCACRIRS